MHWRDAARANERDGLGGRGDRRLTGRGEIDEAYLGGQRSGGKTGRGSENKAPFAAAVQITGDSRSHLAYLSPRPFEVQFSFNRHYNKAAGARNSGC